MPIFENAQWVVTERCVETVDCPRDFGFDLEGVFDFEKTEEDQFYDWPVYIADKGWGDVRLYNEDFGHAIRFYSSLSGKPVDEAMLESGYRRALQIAEEDIDWRLEQIVPWQ